MHRSLTTAQNLVSLFRSRAKTTAARKKPSTSRRSPSSTPVTEKETTSLDNGILRNYISSIKPPSAAARQKAKRDKTKRLLKNFKALPSSTSIAPTSSSLNSIVGGSLASDSIDEDDESAEQLATDVSGILYDKIDLDWDDEDDNAQETPQDGKVLFFPWYETMSASIVSLRKKVESQDKKQKWVFGNNQTSRYKRLVKMCADKLGSNRTLELFGRFGRANGLKEFNALINICIEKARETTDEEVSLQQLYEAYRILKLVRESGFQIEEETYGQFLMYLIDFGMSEEFFFFHELIREDNPESLPRLTYYEMLLRVRVDSEENIKELCRSIATENDDATFYRREALLLALYESDRKKEFLMLLETLDISRITSVAATCCIFRGLGKFSEEPLAERFLLVLKEIDVGAENISNLILEYAISIPNLAVEGVIKKFQALHTKFEVLPTSTQYEKLIRYSCKFLKVHKALNIVDDAFEAGIALSLEAFHWILDACDRSCEFNLVHQVYSRISRHNVEPNSETFRRMILQNVKMKNFEGAYELINDWKQKSKPTTSMYNVILAGYFREKNLKSAHYVLKQMENADVKPDALTYSYLIANSQREKDITKYYNDMRSLEISPSKQVFMSLINAYAAFGNFRNAKEIILNEKIPTKYLKDIKNTLIGALASNGQTSDALELCEEMKGDKCDLDPKAIKSVIEHFQSEGQLNKSLELLQDLYDSPYWIDACFRVVAHCVRHENLRSTVDLLKQLRDKFIDAEVALEVLFDEVFCIYAEQEPTKMEFGISLLEAIKNEVGVRLSRKSLDFLLSACTNAKDAKTSFLVWKEYEKAGLPYNVLSFVRMYQALLASDDFKSAQKLLTKIPKDDGHICAVIKACQEKYIKGKTTKTKKKKALVTARSLLESLGSKTE